MKFKLSDIQPNPFRHLERYPLQPEKIKVLRASIQNTGFWDNIVARVADGSPEIAYGHHRLQALREEYPPDHEVDLIVRDLSDETMIKMMAAENMEEYKSNFDVVMETVRSVVLAYAENRIALEVPETNGPGTGRLRYAPSFLIITTGARRDKRYTVESIENFLNWRIGERIAKSLQALQYIEEGLSTYEDFAGLTLQQATVLLTQVNQTRLRREAEARQAEEIARRAAQINSAATEHNRRTEEVHEERREAGTRETVEVTRRRQQQTSSTTAALESGASRRRESIVPAVREVASTLSRELRSGKVSTRQAPERAREISRDPVTPRSIPDIEVWTRNLVADLFKLFDSNYDPRFATKLDELLPFKSDLNPSSCQNLVRVLETVSQRSQAYAQKFRESSPIEVGQVVSLTQQRRITHGT